VTQGDLTRSITVDATGEVGDLKDTINQMIANLRVTTTRNSEQDWLKSNLARISSMLQGQRDLEAVSRLLMSELTPLVGAQHAAFFLADAAIAGRPEARGGVATDAGSEPQGVLRLIASYGYTARKGVKNRFKVGEGLVGQAALERHAILITEAPVDYIRVASGLGDAPPVNIMVLPVLFEDQVLGVIELASLRPFGAVNQSFLEQIVETVGVVVSTIIANTRTEELLEESQRLAHELQSQSEELQSQQDELRRSNLELENQAQTLRASEELLQVQQEELQQSNSELEEKAAQLAEQNTAIEVKNTQIELSREALEERAEQLALSSRYKSEFLANMSHELRTPLNSLLILAKLLADNATHNLTEKQVEFALSIHGAGHDLLRLISDILDLSKVESGKLELAPATLELGALLDDLMARFRPLADQKGLMLSVAIDDSAPATIESDAQRVAQVLTNLLSNAVKFTDSGSVSLEVSAAPPQVVLLSESLRRSDRVVAFGVSDTGIGIPLDKQMLIFEAFQQADGTTSRRYGGTGLGLSISREIARLLGGEIHVRSTPEEGSTFTLYLPIERPEQPAGHDEPATETPLQHRVVVPLAEAAGFDPESPSEPSRADDSAGNDFAGNDIDCNDLDETGIVDDRQNIVLGDRVLLVVGGDAGLVELAVGLARDRAFKVLVAARGDVALALTRRYRPDAIVLDAQLAGLDGLAILSELKRLPRARHIPVHIISDGGQRQRALAAGAIDYLAKPVSADDLSQALARTVNFLDAAVRRLLVVDDDDRERTSIMELVGGDDPNIEVVGVGSGEEAMAVLEIQHFDCMVLDLKLPETSGFVLLEQIKADKRFSVMPVIVYTGTELNRAEETRLAKFAETIIVKDVRSPERLLDETALFLHRVESNLPADKRRMIEQLHSADAVFEGKRILIVDDDVRNVFALTSAFEALGINVSFAENGREGVEALNANPGIDLVLMDIMMPEMNGYEAMQAIRADNRFARLPIVALTAKAMKGDREQSIAAGASDYITKPVDMEQLLSLMRVWLYQ